MRQRLHSAQQHGQILRAGVTVTAIDAHHCPGAAVLLFLLPTGKKYIHCGDMRYHAGMRADPHLRGFLNPDAVLLDTTYCHPKHTFPLQRDSVDAIAGLAQEYVDEEKPKRCAQWAVSAWCLRVRVEQTTGGATEACVCCAHVAPHAMHPVVSLDSCMYGIADKLSERHDQKLPLVSGTVHCCRVIMISAYNIGKEKVFVEVARRCKRPICVTTAKLELLKLQDWPFDVPFNEVFVSDPEATNIHAVGWNWIGETWPFFRPNYQNIEHFAYSCAPEHFLRAC